MFPSSIPDPLTNSGTYRKTGAAVFLHVTENTGSMPKKIAEKKLFFNRLYL